MKNKTFFTLWLIESLFYSPIINAQHTPSISKITTQTISSRQGDLGNGTFMNPILGGDYPDPSIIRDGKDFYMTHSSFDYLPGLIVYHSTDLINWEPISFALKTRIGSVWAPDICKYKGKYYIYFTVSRHGNFVVYADSPYGPWSDPIDLHIGMIDPCHAVGENGQRWLFLSGGNRVKLTEDGLSIIKGSEKTVYEGWEIPEDWNTEGKALEGPKIKKIGKYYYYLSAEGGTAGPPTSHMVIVARSKSINGPWINSPYNPLIHTYSASERWWSKGHGSLVDTPDGKWWIVYHAYENQYTGLGRQTLLEPVNFTEDDWLKALLGTKIEQPILKPITSHKKIHKDSLLRQFRIGLDWKFYKKYDPDRTYVKNNILHLKAEETDPASSAPLLFIAGSHSYEFSLEIDKDETAKSGILLFYNADFFVGYSFDSRNIYRWRKAATKGHISHSGKNHLWLKVRNDRQIITGFYSYDGKEWEKIPWSMEVSGYNHNTLYDFQSLLPGIFASGKGEVRFSNFKYKRLP